jgi:Fur family peroxide stress response transcriptional regulator
MIEEGAKARTKHSAQREAILGVLRKTKTHPGARWVHDQLRSAMPGLSLATVYRNLALFRREGLALSLGAVNGEERFDGDTASHPHLVCGRCGAVEDLAPPNLETFERGIAAALGETAGENGSGGEALIDFRRTMFYGVCRECQEQARRNGARNIERVQPEKAAPRAPR